MIMNPKRGVPIYRAPTDAESIAAALQRYPVGVPLDGWDINNPLLNAAMSYQGMPASFNFTPGVVFLHHQMGKPVFSSPGTENSFF